MISKIITGDALEQLKNFPDCSVDCCVTSPPYYGLRDYGVEGQIGLEETPEEYIDHLVKVFREVKRVLKNDGTLWIVVGDSYAGSGKGRNKDGAYNDKTLNKQSKRQRKSKLSKAIAQGEYKPKDLIGIPWMLAFALRADGWYLRQDIIWHKPNCMPESVKDRCTKSHEYIFLLSKQSKYYFDAEAISEPVTDSTIKRYAQNIGAPKGSDRQPGKKNGNMKACLPRYGGHKYTQTPEAFYRTKSGSMYNPRPRRNKRDVWSISTAAFKGAHFATFPEKLIEPCILAGCCPVGIVLDPFLGSGTTAVVATKLGRSCIGIELNPEFAKIAKKRVGL